MSRTNKNFQMTKRQEKVNSLLQREVANYLLQEKPAGIAGLLTITGVDVSPDLEHAKVFFSVVGQSDFEVLDILHKHVYKLQGILNRKLRMKKVPHIVFVADQSGKYAQHIHDLIRHLHDHDRKE